MVATRPSFHSSSSSLFQVATLSSGMVATLATNARIRGPGARILPPTARSGTPRLDVAREKPVWAAAHGSGGIEDSARSGALDGAAVPTAA
jgi:hypothetical protein